MGYLGLYIGYLIIVGTPVFGLWSKIFKRLDQPAWAAYIPFYNYFVALRACNQPWYWVIFLLMPGIQFYMWAAINVTLIRRFGEFGVKETVLGILFPYPVFWKIANNPEKYPPTEPTNWDIEKQVNRRTPSDHVALFFALPVLGHAIAYPLSIAGFKRKSGKKSVIKEWGDAILFALIAASAIRTYVFEPYTIPTGSMEKTLMVGDYLFVEKFTYGPRVPMTPFSFPVVHNSFAPFVNVKSYTELQTIPYTRIPGIRFVERNDVTVFNFPAGEKALDDPRMPYGLIGHTYYQILTEEAFRIALDDGKTAQEFEENKAFYIDRALLNFEQGKVFSRAPYDEDRERGYTEIGGILERPVDKRENYIKRCVAIAGDSVRVVNKELYVNNELAYQSPNLQYSFFLSGVGSYGHQDVVYMQKHFNLLDSDISRIDNGSTSGNPGIYFSLEKMYHQKLNQAFGNRVQLNVNPKGSYQEAANSAHRNSMSLAQQLKQNGKTPSYYPIFPNDPQYDWTEDNFGPLRIPEKGDVVELNERTIPLYRRIISVHEGHELEEKADGIYIDGKKATQYTIEMDYYWLMGDNRNNSADSRFWGFVPEDHIVGKAAFIWMSVGPEGMFGGGLRWERIFNGIN